MNSFRSKMITAIAADSITHSSLPHSFSLIPLVLVLVYLALSPLARAVNPPPDGGYAGQNTAEGTDALFGLTAGTNNTAVGFEALFDNTTGSENTASGAFALLSNSDGSFNTATGWEALFDSTTGGNNTATGAGALGLNTTGSNNTATGYFALVGNTTGGNNTANGSQALYSNTSGCCNTATGLQALYSDTTGNNNTATGEFALLNNTAGSDNIALGFGAGAFLTTGSNNIDIGNAGIAGESNKIRIGTVGTHNGTFIAGIRGATVPSGVGVIVGANGKLGTVVSSKRFKEAIRPMDKASEVIFEFNPVTFHYKKDIDPKAIAQFGLVAEEVERISPELVAYDHEGKPYTVRYEAVNAMLLNEFLKEHRKVEQQEGKIARQQKQIEALAADLQKVSAQLELGESAPQTVFNNQ